MSDLDLSQAKVLMVDDTPANIDVLHKVLAPEGYKLSFANSGKKALKIVSRALPDLILLDIMMPETDGLETCRRLKADEATQDIPVIFITAKSDTDDLVEGFQAGAVDYITKPFRREEVCVRVRTHLESRMLMKQREQLINNLRATEERFRLLATWSPVGIFQTDSQGAYTYTNQKWRQIFGLDSGNELGSAWLHVVHADDRDIVQQAWQDSVNARRSYHAAFRIRSANGHIHWVDIRTSVLLNDDGSAEGFVGSAEDVTDAKQKEERMLLAKEAAESEIRAKSEFLASMTHELRTPLNAIIGYSEMLADDMDDIDDGSELSKITSAGKYLLSLINDVLDLSKVDADKMQVYAQEFDVMPLIKDVGDTIQPLVAKNNNRLLIEESGEIRDAFSDETKLRQILFNLLSNACKFTRDSNIVVSVKRYQKDNADWLDFSVKDEGIGMTPEQIERLFQRYVQAEASTSHRYGGTGLGLVLSRQLAVILGGDIQAQSGMGEGSVFTLSIPALLPERKSPTQS